jgi:membrane-associated phospholipid phosphatase
MSILNHLPQAPAPLQSLWRASLALSALAVAGGVVLHLSPGNASLMLAVHARASALPWAWEALTHMGEAGFVLVLLMYCMRKQPAGLSLLLKTWLLGALVSQFFKRAFDLPRPAAVVETTLLFLIGHPPLSGHSMPSGHSMAAGSAAAIVLLVLPAHRRWLLPAVLGLSLLVACSRVAVGAHWPADVLVGWGLGWWVVAAAAQWERHQPWQLGLTQSRWRLALPILSSLLLISFALQPNNTTPAIVISSAGAALGLACLWHSRQSWQKRSHP